MVLSTPGKPTALGERRDQDEVASKVWSDDSAWGEQSSLPLPILSDAKSKVKTDAIRNLKSCFFFNFLSPMLYVVTEERTAKTHQFFEFQIRGSWHNDFAS